MIFAGINTKVVTYRYTNTTSLLFHPKVTHILEELLLPLLALVEYICDKGSRFQRIAWKGIFLHILLCLLYLFWFWFNHRCAKSCLSQTNNILFNQSRVIAINNTMITCTLRINNVRGNQPLIPPNHFKTLAWFLMENIDRGGFRQGHKNERETKYLAFSMETESLQWSNQ